MSTENKNITILGAGLVGSLLSIYLSRRGYNVSIYERRVDKMCIRERYNFHTYSFKLDYSNFGNLYRSYLKLKISISEQILFTLITIIALVNVFFLSEKVVLWLFPFGVLSLLFSIPLWGIKRKFRIRESLFVKMPLLAAVWSVTTVIIPLVDQNINPASPFVIQQTVCRFIFVFILYIPFEIRDMEIDKSENIKTIPSVFGVGRTKISGALLVALEIIIHHLMPVSCLLYTS